MGAVLSVEQGETNHATEVVRSDPDDLDGVVIPHRQLHPLTKHATRPRPGRNSALPHSPCETLTTKASSLPSLGPWATISPLNIFVFSSVLLAPWLTLNQSDKNAEKRVHRVTPQAMMVTETIMEHLASSIGIESSDLRAKNMYKVRRNGVADRNAAHAIVSG